MNDDQEVRSPCISVCVMNAADVCLGCYRNAEEITDWFMASAEDKRAILKRAAERRAVENPVRLS